MRISGRTVGDGPGNVEPLNTGKFTNLTNTTVTSGAGLRLIRTPVLVEIILNVSGDLYFTYLHQFLV